MPEQRVNGRENQLSGAVQHFSEAVQQVLPAVKQIIQNLLPSPEHRMVPVKARHRTVFCR